MSSALPSGTNDIQTETPKTVSLGDVVRLKSGGPIMTVGNPSRDPYAADKGEGENTPGVHTCYWFVEHEVRSGSFHVGALEPHVKEGVCIGE